MRRSCFLKVTYAIPIFNPLYWSQMGKYDFLDLTFDPQRCGAVLWHRGQNPSVVAEIVVRFPVEVFIF